MKGCRAQGKSWPPPHGDNTELGVKFSVSVLGVCPHVPQERSFQREPCPEVGLLLCSRLLHHPQE